MVESFSVRNFKCFRDLELPRLTGLTIIGGRNGVGKTALLEALFMFLDRMNPHVTTGQYARRGVAAVPLTPDGVFAPIFAGYDMSGSVRLRGRINDVDEEMTAAYNPAYSAASVAVQDAAPGSGTAMVPTDTQAKPVASLDITYRSSSKRQDGAHVLLQPGALSLKVDQVVTDIPRAAILGSGPPDPNLVSQRYGEMDVAGTQGRIIEALRVVEPRLVALSSVQTGSGVLMHADVGLGRKLPISFVSEGLSRLLAILVFVGTCPGGLVLVDEIENGIHHGAMAGVWRGLAKATREFNCQVVATTHSYACIESAAEGTAGDFAEDLSYVRLERLKDETLAKTYDRASLDTALAHGFEVR